MPLQELESAAEFDALDSSHAPVLAYFSTPACSVCHALKPRVEALLKDKGLQGFFVDTTEVPELAGRFLIFAVPTIIVLTDGREAARLSRIVSLDELEYVLDRSQAELETRGD